jgi:hypothetical protein
VISDQSSDELPELIEKCCLLPYVPFPRVVQSPQIGGIALRNDNGQGASDILNWSCMI